MLALKHVIIVMYKAPGGRRTSVMRIIIMARLLPGSNAFVSRTCHRWLSVNIEQPPLDLSIEANGDVVILSNSIRLWAKFVRTLPY